MRPKIAMWSDYRSPPQTRWRSRYRRSTRSSIALKILLVAFTSIVAVVGISGIYSEIVDSEWVQNAASRAKRTAVAEVTTRRGPGLVTTVPLSPRGAATTTGEALVSPLRAEPPPPAAAEPPGRPTSVAALQSPPNETALAVIPDAQAVADSPTNPAAQAAIPVFKPAQRYVSRAPAVKKRVARTEHHRSRSGAYAQNAGGWGGGWGGWPGLGSPYHF
jgi:hypothetical protein